MASQRSFSYGLVVGAILFYSSFVNQVSSLSIEYCSSQNTAETQTNSSIYQSNGLCYGFCLSDWAFAILQEDACWCSNEAPGTTTSTSDCNFPCHGYPNDLCGSSDGLFGYLALTKSPTATADGAASTVADQFESDTTPTPTTSPVTTPSTLSTSSSPSSTWTPTPVTSLETVTGQVKTVTVTPTVPPTSQNLSAVSKNSGGGLSTGAAVGLTVGLVALVVLVCSILYFCWRKRQKEREVESEAFNNEGSQRGSSSGLGGLIPSRTMSENSRYILGTDGRQVVETWEPESQDAAGSRKSRLMPVDPRLNPFAPVYQRGENKSRESMNTIRDDHDYSRRVVHQTPILRATNPDD